MVNRFTIVRPGEPLPKGIRPDPQNIIDLSDPVVKAEPQAEEAPAAASATQAPQASDRFQTEMYKAMEILGRKLERAEDENARLSSRLAQIESATAVDEKTGRIYLPAVVGGEQSQNTAAPSLVTKSTFAASTVSIMVAFFALGLAFFHQPQAPITMGVVLSKEQLAALDSITAQHMAGLNTVQQAAPDVASANDAVQPGGWQKIETFTEKEAPVVNAAPTASPASAPVVAETPAVPAKEDFQKDTSIAAGLLPETDPALKQPQEKKMPVAAAPVTPVEVAPAAPIQPQAQETQTDVGAETSNAYAGVEKDANLPAALQKVEKRAFAGVAEAQHDLATVYASGKSVPQDYKRAVYWFSRAADGGIANAHYNLGVMFQQGLGLHKDPAKAIGWYKSAAELGHPEAMYNLGIAYIDGVGITQNIERGAGYFKRAAAAGVAQAAYNLGVLYESGFLGAVDLDQALHWYTQAKNKKHAEAADAIARIKKQKQPASKLPPALPLDPSAEVQP